MSDGRTQAEKTASSENDWVRARILKQDLPSEGSLLRIAERPLRMAANSLGKEHAGYAVALQNLGLYYDAIENDPAKANAYFAQARAVLKANDLPLAYGFYWRGIFHNQVTRDRKRAEAALTQALTIQRRPWAAMIRDSRTRRSRSPMRGTLVAARPKMTTERSRSPCQTAEVHALTPNPEPE